MGIELRKTTLAVPLLTGVLGLALLAWLATEDPRGAAFAYLEAFTFGASLLAGTLLLVLIGRATRARWFVALRRPLEAIVATLPVLAILFIPIAIGLRAIYPWAREGWGATHAVSAGKQLWLSPVPFIARSAGYLLLWSVLGVALWRWSRRTDAHPDAVKTQRPAAASSAALPAFVLSVVLASMDWTMSLEPGWMSAIYGLDALAHAFRSGVAVAVLACWGLSRRGLLPARVGPDHFHALGRLLLTGVILAAYTELSQGLLVWIADLPREVPYYLVRAQGSWGWVLVGLVVGELAIPLVALLPRVTKRRPDRLALAAAWLILVQAGYVHWLVAPVLHPRTPAPGPAELVALAGVVGVLGAAWAFVLRGVPVMPVNDPELSSSLRYVAP